MLKTTGSSVPSASRVDDNEIVGGGGGAGTESGGSVDRSDTSRYHLNPKFKQKLCSNIRNNLKYPEYKNHCQVYQLRIYN